MTLHLLDVSRWQHPIDLSAVRFAGFGAVNVQLSGKDGYVFPEAAEYVDRAIALGLGVCVYHWLDGRLPGAVQAEQAWQRIQATGGAQGRAVAVDCEDTGVPATWPVWRDFVRAMQDRLGRPVVAYSADWWWEVPQRRWPGAVETPYAWAAPNPGYPGAYPGDDSPLWRAGWGGWQDLAVMQYAVADVAGVRCSLSAIRHPGIWQTLTGGAPVATWRVSRGLDRLLAQINELAPARSKASDGSIGNDAHCPPGYDRDHPPSEHCPDAAGVVRARDFTHDPQHGADMHVIAEQLRRSRDRRIRYVIWNGRIFSSYTSSAGRPAWTWGPYVGDNPHDKHMHVSTVADNALADDQADWQIGADVDLDDVVYTSSAGPRTVRAILQAQDTRTAVLMGDRAAVLAAVAGVLTEVSDDAANPIVLGPEQVTELAGLIAGRLPGADEIRAVVDEELDEQARAGADQD